MRNDGIVRTCVGIVTAAMAASCAWAAHYYAAPGGTGDYTQGSPGGDPAYCSRNMATNSGDVIHLAAGTYDLTKSSFLLNKGVSVIGASDDPADTVVDSGGTNRNFNCHDGTSVRNLTMRNGYTAEYQGGAICRFYAGETYMVSNCVVEGASALYWGGGGANGVWYDTVIRNCEVRMPGYNDTFDGSGGGVWGATLYRCTITNNYAAYAGGGVSGGANGTCKAYNCTIGWNEAAFGGGAGVKGGLGSAYCQLVGCTVVSNTVHALTNYIAEKGGGAHGCWLTNCIVTGNSARLAGGGLNRALAVDCTISGNTTTNVDTTGNYGGGGAAESVLTNCVVTGNVSYYVGAGLYNSTAVDTRVLSNRLTSANGSYSGGAGAAKSTLLRCTVAGNDVGAIYQGGGARDCVLTNCVVSENKAYYTGAGLFNSTAVDTQIVSNRLTATATSGQETTGGAGAAGSTLLRCTVEGNDAGIVFFGGGLRACEATDCVIRYNQGPYGGGGYNGLFVRCMVSNNVATTRMGGGIYNATSYNCVVTGNIATNRYTGTDPNTSWGRGAVCRGYYQGCLIYSNFYYTGAAVTAHKGATDITIVNCTVFGNWAGDGNHNGFGGGYATNCIVYGHPNTDVYNAQALVNSLWGVDMTSHGQTDPRLALAVNCKARVNPQFTMQTGTNACPFSLKGSSPARNAGLPLDWMAVMDKDILGNARVRENAPDMGACEYHGPIGLIISVW